MEALWLMLVLRGVCGASLCQCGTLPPPIETAYHNADAIYEGTVIAESRPGQAEATIVVRRIWKGQIADTVKVPQDPVSPCAYPFVAGITYVVYESQGVVSLCQNRTGPVSERKAEMVTLDSLAAVRVH